MTLTIALYKARGRLDDRLVRLATRSAYSHVELVDDHAMTSQRTRTAWAVSSSRRDRGVRARRITFEAGKWDFLPVSPWAPDGAFEWAGLRAGEGYDWAAILGVFCVPLRRHAEGRWTCSELIGRALGLEQPHLLAPGDLAWAVQDLNDAWAAGHAAGKDRT